MRLDRLNGLVAFLVVAEKQGFSAAARVLGVSPSALSQSVRALESRLGTALLVRTTRRVALTETGERLLQRCGPGLREAAAALDDIAKPTGVISGRLRLTIPHVALSFLEPVLSRLRTDHPELALEVIVDDAFVDVVEQGYDAGVRLFESMERDMVVVRAAPAFRFVIVGSPGYLERRGRPEHPRDLLNHECIGFRSMSTGALYVWELERRGQEFKVPVTGPFVTNDGGLMVRVAARGFGLAYVPEFSARERLRSKELETVLDEFVPTVPGLFLYFPERSKNQPKMQALLAALRRSKSRGSARHHETSAEP
jgi:DNA-binding transcriptional LysR family regulator